MTYVWGNVLTCLTSSRTAQNSLPPLKPAPKYGSAVPVLDGPYGVHDTFRGGITKASAGLGLSHPVEQIQNLVCYPSPCARIVRVCLYRTRRHNDYHSAHGDVTFFSIQHDANQEEIRLTMLGNIQGAHMPMRIRMERALVSKVSAQCDINACRDSVALLTAECMCMSVSVCNACAFCVRVGVYVGVYVCVCALGPLAVRSYRVAIRLSFKKHTVVVWPTCLYGSVGA